MVDSASKIKPLRIEDPNEKDYLDISMLKDQDNSEKEHVSEKDFDPFDYGNEVTSVPKMKNGLELTPEFEKAYLAIENTNDCIFLTGNAGSGKTTFLRHWLSHTKKRTVVLSPTGMGALNLAPIKATTIHKFFGFKPLPLTESNIPRIPAEMLSKKERFYNAIDTIVIDECSMVSSLMLQAIDSFYRINFDKDEPFGGIQIILVGDLAQLPPVVPNDAERMYIEHRFKSKYFFDAEVLQRTGLKMIHFSRIFRQRDQDFVDYLNKIRMGTINALELEQLNRKCYTNKVSQDALVLCTVNKQVQFINEKRLAKIEKPLVTLRGEIEGDFNIKNCPVEEEIDVKEGCKIMCRNNDPEGKWCNGTVGEFVRQKDEDTIIIKINDEYHEMSRFKFEQTYFIFNPKEGKLESKSSASFTAFPITLAYAISIHKSQGSTYDEFKIDIGRGAFDSGQFYVALSRGTNLDGINFIEPISMRDIIIDPIVSNFYKRMEENNDIL